MNEKKTTPQAKDYANRVIALHWAKEEQRSFIEGTFDAGYVCKALEKSEPSPSTPVDINIEAMAEKEYPILSFKDWKESDIDFGFDAYDKYCIHQIIKQQAFIAGAKSIQSSAAPIDVDEMKRLAEHTAKALGYNIDSLSLEVINVKESFCQGYQLALKYQPPLSRELAGKLILRPMEFSRMVDKSVYNNNYYKHRKYEYVVLDKCDHDGDHYLYLIENNMEIFMGCCQQQGLDSPNDTINVDFKYYYT